MNDDANARIKDLEDALANAQSRLEQGEDLREILVDLFVDTGFAERKDVVATPLPGTMAAKPV